MSYRFLAGCLLAILPTLVSSTSQAEIIVSIVGATLPIGGSGLIDVYATSDADISSPDRLNEFGITLQIFPSQSTHLEFASLGQPRDYLLNSDYIFAGTTGSYRQSPDALLVDLVTVSTTNYSNDTIYISDYTLDDSTVGLSSASSPLLLARLLVTAAPPSGGAPGLNDLFTIGLVPASGIGTLGDATFFDVYDSNLGSGTSPVPYRSTAGTVLIGTPAVAVPEPSTLLLSTIACAITASIGRTWRKMQHQRVPDQS